MLLAAYQMCWALWYGTADEKLSTSHLCFAATIGAAICAEQSSANSQPDYMCHNMTHKTLLGKITQKLAGLFDDRRGRLFSRKGQDVGEVINRWRVT